ncbi:TPA: hypothetical protein ACKP8D_000083 [Pseudomonas putida]
MQFKNLLALKLKELNAPEHAVKSINEEFQRHLDEYKGLDTPLVQFSLNHAKRTRYGIHISYEAATRLHHFTENKLEYYLID